ncbi:MAG: multicopper oxidase domain-containing protein [Chloroflexi bacterium]|nr:multicopper oxidase domain-containing protein [Chloroflexota bacterium]
MAIRVPHAVGRKPDGRSVPVIALVLWVIGALVLIACSRGGSAPQVAPPPLIGPGPASPLTPSTTHPHSVDTPEHSHAEPSSAGEALQRDLEERLAESGANGHESNEGIVLLGGEGGESVAPGAFCGPDAPVSEYRVVAIDIEITLNRFLDYDPDGRMFVLEERLERARREEAQNRLARAGGADPAVSHGLQGDAIQPLIIRANQGDCLRLTFRNAIDAQEPASIHIHGSGLYIAATREAATAANPDSYASPDTSVTYEWMIGGDEPEGTHYFHSHGVDRFQTSHGLFGAVIVEPLGSEYLDTLTGKELLSGWAAIIRDPDGSDFREFAIVYHEIGDESYRHLDKNGEPVLDVDPYTGAYRPGARAINYRSEPFFNRMQLQSDAFGAADISMAYSSYTFGDPATPIARTYLGDPVKKRLIHGGSEVFHVHHEHGGAIRWRRQPGTENTSFDTGLNKRPELMPKASARVDAQSIGPSETFDIENECGSGGCQESTGDFLIHCHVANHYVAGMWMIWRVYNTLQDGDASQDALPPLVELRDRAGKFRAAVTSEALVNTEVDWRGRTFDITAENLQTWVERQLPPSGVPNGYDASVMDWSREGRLYLNQAESPLEWPGYTSQWPGERLPLYFNPNTGKLAYPFLRPHLGQRPPFAPNHGPTPYLEPIRSGNEFPAPGQNGPWSLCPSGARAQEFNIQVITTPILYNEKFNLIDEQGQIFVLKEEEERIRADNDLRVPLAIRGNAGQDCADITLRSELEDENDRNRFSKVNIHIHFVQFDIQASDGVSTGFNYEQSIRPFKVEGESLTAGSMSGDTSIALASADRFQRGALVGVGMDQDSTFEVKRIREVLGDYLLFETPLEFDHAIGEIVSTEFVRYRWYPDVQFGTAYFHDHVNAISGWQHGLFGAFISEPPDSTYHSPFSGEEIRSGPIVDIHTESVVSRDIIGSFREMVMFIQDQHPTVRVTGSSGSAFNLRAEPLVLREGDPSKVFSSWVHGDPATPILEAFVGDPIVVRTLVSATNDIHTWHIDGHWFRVEPYSLTSPPTSTIHLGISERYDLMIPQAGGPQLMSGDYIYSNGRASRLLEGSWGLLRVHDGGAKTALRRLPGREVVPTSASNVCPLDAPSRSFQVVAIDASLPMLGGTTGKVFTLRRDVEGWRSGEKKAEPLVLHANVGDCIQVTLDNETASGRVSFHADMLAFDPKKSYGIDVGFNPSQTVAPGESRVFTFYAHPAVGETAALVRDGADVITNPALGLYGAIIVGPEGSTYADPFTGEDASEESSWAVVVAPPDGNAYRDFTLIMQDGDLTIGTNVMPYRKDIEGVLGMNYWTEPLSALDSVVNRGGSGIESSLHLPAFNTPTMQAFLGDPIRVHVLVPYSQQSQVFSIEGHRWPFEPGRLGSDVLDSVKIGGLEALTLRIAEGAGGPGALPGDYIYGNHRGPYREAGMWGIFRVYGMFDAGAPILRIPRD